MGGSLQSALELPPRSTRPRFAVGAAHWTFIAAASMVAVLLALGIQVAIARA